MEDVDAKQSSETEPRSKTIGILLTAGSQEKLRGGQRIEPDLEGKVRALGALDDLANGKIDRLFVVGGAKAHDRPHAEHYKNFLRRFTRKYSLKEDSIEKGFF